MVRRNFAGGLPCFATPSDVAGFGGCQQRSGKLNVGEMLIAEPGVALVLLPTVGTRKPRGRLLEITRRDARTLPTCRIQRPRPVAIVVARETMILARPGGNITGLSDFNTGVVAKRLELLKEAVPSVSRVAVLSIATNPTNPPQLKLIEDAARVLGVTVISVEVRGAPDVDRASLLFSLRR